jgi:hypothetical protein
MENDNQFYNVINKEKVQCNEKRKAHNCVMSKYNIPYHTG